MDGLFKPPDPLVLDGNISENWRKFEQRFDLFLVAADLDKKAEGKKVAVFLNVIGEDALELYNTFTFTEEEKKEKTLTLIKQKFTEYCSPKKNVIFERFKFNSIVQAEGQTFDNFLTDLRKAVQTTEYSDPDDMIRDRIVMGIKNKIVQERLLREADITLQKTIDFCRASEVSKNQSKVLQQEVDVSTVKQATLKCKYCGYKHAPKKCPAFKKTCAKCQGKNHFASVCTREKATNETKKYTKKRKDVHEVSGTEDHQLCGSEESGESECEFYVSAIKREAHKESMWFKKVEICGKSINFKLDTGAEVSVLPVNILETLPKCRIEKSNVSLVSYGSTKFKITPVGEAELKCKVNKYVCNIKFVIVDTRDQMPLLGLQDCIRLHLIKRVDELQASFKSSEDVVNRFPSVFQGLGTFPNKHHITLNENVSPTVAPIRRVPQILHNRLKLKLEELEKSNSIRKVEHPTEWLQPLVIVEKPNGDLRLCLDPKQLNCAIKREHFLIPSMEEISAKLSGKKFFTVLDMKDGYWQLLVYVPRQKYSSEKITNSLVISKALVYILTTSL
ncbi:uncharacterized protein K02A2.6-like [Photinus pyralis]|uniref:uncharacterized protein K02A2.6-like n=1 Tax=Photinus pyralis TaxID=7054 RepID=UPI00126713D4|nr:uncharacterized protein K02A2.6-like [Photinus pyralis]XP_031349729.1 uncharacterized protein K02A2.6-like [Photinus pyralis]XP_031350492.1 uncharacterized protein K02A2.6-like [Photinus pyralis]XP_031358733.1 uncharacterized protein K02A2.6-like [Photinus pyralis]